MIAIPELKNLPIKCYGCPNAHPADMDGPAYCSIKVMITQDYFNSLPDIQTCPLKEVSAN